MENKIQKDKIIDLWQQGTSYRQCANIVNNLFAVDYWDSERVRDIIRKHRRKVDKREVNALLSVLETENKNCNIEKKNRNKILIMSDLHIPFQRDDILENIKKHKDEIFAITFAGDILDMYEVSKYPSLKQIPVESELIEGIKFFKEVRNIVGDSVEIILINGNHEQRWSRFIANMHKKQLYKFINPNVLEMLNSGFTLYENGEERKYEGLGNLKIINSWYVNINDMLIVCHPINFSKIEVRNAKMAIEHFISAGEKFKVCAVGHNHHQGFVPNYLGKCGIELGCLCEEFDYSDGYTSSRPQDYGYYLLALDDDNEYDFNESKLYTLKTKDDKKRGMSQIKLLPRKG